MAVWKNVQRLRGFGQLGVVLAASLNAFEEWEAYQNMA